MSLDFVYLIQGSKQELGLPKGNCEFCGFIPIHFKLCGYFEVKSAIGKCGILIYGFLENLPISMRAHVQGDGRTIFKRVGCLECVSSCVITEFKMDGHWPHLLASPFSLIFPRNSAVPLLLDADILP